MEPPLYDQTVINDLVSCIEAFVRHFPESSRQVLPLVEQISDPNHLYDRKNMAGHVTASAFVINPERTHVLCIKHKALGVTIPPGGHIEFVEADGVWEHPMMASRREAKEETGVVTCYGMLPYPIDIDTHPIPEREEKGEGLHRHHDLMFLHSASDIAPLDLDFMEVESAAWMAIADAEEWADARTLRILKRLEEKLSYFDDVVDTSSTVE